MLVAVSSHVAEAGGYLGLGVGTSPSINSEHDTRFTTNGRSAKLLGGMRWGQWSVEGAVGGVELSLFSNSRAVLDLYQAQLAGRFSLPLGSGFEAYGRAGVQHAWLSSDNPMIDMQGSGLLVGAGFEYRINLAVGSGSIFVDYTYAKSNLEGHQNTYDLNTRMWTLGITVGI
ncbi:MAG: outer membrane beta-barrel protein [Deltaproteobacteria bacterium]|nr:outer membrane beta-barrel protein [Deltaproteobacteria bacterium]